MNYTKFHYIAGNSNLAAFFNSIMRRLQGMRMLCAPVDFYREAEIAEFQDERFCAFCRYELWMHSVVHRLEEWVEILNTYFVEFNGSWEYYARSKRSDYIKETGEDVEEELESFSVISDLYDKDVRDIVQDTVPDNLNDLCADLIANSQIDFVEHLKERVGEENITLLKKAEDGTLVPISREEYELNNITQQVDAEDDVVRLKAVASGISVVIQMLKRCRYDEDNTENLQSIYNAAQALLRIDFHTLSLIIRQFIDKLKK